MIEHYRHFCQHIFDNLFDFRIAVSMHLSDTSSIAQHLKIFMPNN